MRTKAMLYFDTSALLKLYIKEKGSELVQSTLTSQDQPLPVWEIQQAELINALRLKVFWGDIKAEQADQQITLLWDRYKRGLYLFPELDRNALMKRFQELSIETMRLGCRTMDILHVACALEIKADKFMSFDQCQLELAAHAGLDIVKA